MNDLHHWMTHALSQAHQALPQDVPVGAVLVQGNRLLTQAHNRREIDCNPVGHAEILALQQAAQMLGNWRLRDCTLYVTLEPCPMCAAAIQQARIPRVVFGAYDPIMGACGSALSLLQNGPERQVIGGIQEEACAGLLRDFFLNRRQP